MVIAAISQLGARTPYARRSAAAARASRPPTSNSVQAADEQAEVEAGDDGEVDHRPAAAPQQGMTLAGAQAAYASN